MLKRIGRLAEKNEKIKDTEKTKIHVSFVRNGLRDSKEEIKRMSDDEKEIEKPNGIVDIVEKVLEVNNQNQQEQGLKILTLDQMLSRLPIF